MNPDKIIADAVISTASELAKRAARSEETTLPAKYVGKDAEGKGWVLLPGADSPTPLSSASVEAEPGDAVIVTIGNNRAKMNSNVSNPSAGTSSVARVGMSAREARETAVTALANAETARSAARAAQSDAANASSAAQNAQASADKASAAASQAISDAESAAAAASAAQSSADAAATAALVADGKAVAAGEAATAAQGSADAARGAADSALVQLATVEDVVGTATWIAEHGIYEPTDDAAVDDSKVYYERTGSGTQADPYVYTAVAQPTDEGLAGYYELNVRQAVSQYVASHLALTDAGLRVLRDGSGYSLLVASDGVSVIDPGGNMVVTYGATIAADPSRPFSIGNEDAYVLFTPATQSEDAKVVIGGNVVLGESRTLSELMAEVDGTLVFKVTESYSQDGSTVTLTAHVYKGGQDIAPSYRATDFAWYRKNEDGAPEVPLGNGRTITVSRSDVGFGAAIKCNFTPPNDSVLLDSDDDALTDSDDTPLAVRTPSGDYVRVAELQTTTTVFDTDKLMLVGSEEEQLVTIATLKDVFGDGDYERLDNMPSIEDVTLVGNKTFPDLGIFRTDSQGYDVPDDYTLSTMDINALWANAQPIGA